MMSAPAPTTNKSDPAGQPAPSNRKMSSSSLSNVPIALLTPEELEDEVQTLRRKLQTCVATNKMQSQTIDLLERQVGVEHDRAVTAESQLLMSQKEKEHVQDLLASLTERHEITLQQFEQNQQELQLLKSETLKSAALIDKKKEAEDGEVPALRQTVAELKSQLHDAKNKCSIMAARLVASVRNAQIDEAGEVGFCIRMLEEERESFYHVITALAAEVRLDTTSLRELFDKTTGASEEDEAGPHGAPAFVPAMVIKSNEVVNAVRGSLAEMRLTHARTLQTVENAVPFIKEIRKHVERAARIVFSHVQSVNPVRARSLGTTSFVAIGGAHSPRRSEFVEPTPSPRPTESVQSTFSVHNVFQQPEQPRPVVGINTSYGAHNTSTGSHNQPQPQSPPIKGYTSRGAAARHDGGADGLADHSAVELDVACDFLRATLHAFDDLTKILSTVFPDQRGRPGDEDPVESIIASVERDLQRFLASSNETVRTLSNRIGKEISTHRDNAAQLRQRLSCAEAEYTSLLMTMHHASPQLLEQLEQHYASVVAPPAQASIQLRHPAPAVAATPIVNSAQRHSAASASSTPLPTQLPPRQHKKKEEPRLTQPVIAEQQLNDSDVGEYDSRNSLQSDTLAGPPVERGGASLDFPPHHTVAYLQQQQQQYAPRQQQQRYVAPPVLVSPQF